MAISNARLAKEWLIFLFCSVLGATITYFAFYYHVPNNPYHFMKYLNAGDMWNDMVSRGSLNLWATTFAPYLGISVLRSIIWAVRSIREG